MARKIATRNGRSKNLWWITGAVVGIFSLCAGAAVIVRYFNPPQPTPLPQVPTFGYASPTPTFLVVGSPLPSGIVSPTVLAATNTPYPTSTLIPTSTSSSFLRWIFPGFFQGVQPTSIPYYSPTPLQAVVVSLTPTITASAFPPPPTQGTPNPVVCNNILYPARPGNHWNYYVTTPGHVGNADLRIVTVEGTQAIVDVTDISDGSTGRGYAQCDQDIILNCPLLGVQSIVENFVNGTMYMDYMGGVLAPNESAFLASNWALSWKILYRVYGSGSIMYHDRNFDFSMDPSMIEMTCQTTASGDAAFENLTVTAGSFRALKVICRGEGQVLALVNGSQVTGSISAQATQWFAPRIGLLRLQSDYVTLNVFGISIPLNEGGHAGIIELNSYTVSP